MTDTKKTPCQQLGASSAYLLDQLEGLTQADVMLANFAMFTSKNGASVGEETINVGTFLPGSQHILANQLRSLADLLDQTDLPHNHKMS